MAIKFQYNKTAMQQLKKQLSVRERALPTLQNKEAALRIEVKQAKDTAAELDEKITRRLDELSDVSRLWCEFDTGLVTVKDVVLGVKKIAGVRTPVLEDVVLETAEFSMVTAPSWYVDGVELIRELILLTFERDLFVRKMEMLDYARKKTTQKVNLYEKVQIPGFEDAIRKIKRFLEDEENLSKSAQKIVKKRAEQAEAG